jgi:hypothetical protein
VTFPRLSGCARRTTPIRRDDAGFQIDRSVAKQGALAILRLDETQSDARRFDANAGDELRAEVFYEAVARAQREGPDQSREVERFGGVQHLASVVHELADLCTERDRPGCRNESTSGANEQRITGRDAQSRERAAHRRRTETQPAGRLRHAALGEQHIECDEKVEVWRRHASKIVSFLYMAPHASISCN